MALFTRRNGEPVNVPDVHSHASALTTKKNSAAVTLAELRARIAALEDDHRAALLENRFEDASSLASELDYAKSDLTRAEAAHNALAEAEKEVNRERVRLDLQERMAAAQQRKDAAMAAAQQKLAELPLLVTELQQLARAALADEAEMQDSYREFILTQNSLDQFDSPTIEALGIVIPPRPVTTMFERNPQYRSLANGTWFLGLAGGPDTTP